MTYHNVTANLTGVDRDDALEAMDDDHDFDAWMIAFDKKRARMEAEFEAMRKGDGGRKAKPGRVAISKEEFLKKTGGVRGG